MPTDPDFVRLAGFLARLNELSLADVLEIRREGMRSAHHALDPESLRSAAHDRWVEQYAVYRLDEDPYEEIFILSLSYCLAANDPRRVIVIYDGGRRIMYPLWWDKRHMVSGVDGQTRVRGRCTDGCLHPED